MIFNPEPGQFDPRHPPLAGTTSPEEAAASWKDRRIYDPRVDGYGPQLKLYWSRTTLHVSTHAGTFPTHAGTCPNMPVQARTCLHNRRIAFSERKPLCERDLHRWIRIVTASRRKGTRSGFGCRFETPRAGSEGRSTRGRLRRLLGAAARVARAEQGADTVRAASASALPDPRLAVVAMMPMAGQRELLRVDPVLLQACARRSE